MVGTGKRVSRYGEQNVCEREDEHSLTKREPVQDQEKMTVLLLRDSEDGGPLMLLWRCTGDLMAASFILPAEF